MKIMSNSENKARSMAAPNVAGAGYDLHVLSRSNLATHQCRMPDRFCVVS